MDEIFKDRRVKPRVFNPNAQMVGEPHYPDPRNVAWVEREAPGMGWKTPRWRVQHLRANDLGTGSMQIATGPLRRKREALEAFEMFKGGTDIMDAESHLIAQRREAARLRRQQRQNPAP
jgi:hypothetical protein